MAVLNESSFIVPDWPAPPAVRAIATTRIGGVSREPYAHFNLGDHVGDQLGAVARNRESLRLQLGLDSAPRWLNQIHGTTVVDVATAGLRPKADGCIASAPGQVCVVLTADCLPVLLCDRDGRHVAALHAGWRGMAAGVIEAGVGVLARAGAPPPTLLTWLGPAIGPQAYEVGDDVRDAFLRTDAGASEAFRESRPGHWFFDLCGAARRRLTALGVTEVHGGQWCTLADPHRFFSHRRDGVTGRQATLIWLA